MRFRLVMHNDSLDDAEGDLIVPPGADTGGVLLLPAESV